jgi:cyanophycinase-like exopeptidase
VSRRKPIFLIAGDPGNRHTGSDPLLRTVFCNCGVSSPSIAYIGAASNDNRGFFGWLSGIFTKSGSGAVTLAPTARRFERRFFEKTCEAADAVFVSGGDVEEGMNVLARRGLAPFLSELYRGGKLILGISAGSIMLARAWVRWADDDDSLASRFPCLGIADILCDTHGEKENWGELRALLRLSPDSSIGYGIWAGSAIRVDPDGTVAPIGTIDTFVKQGGVVRHHNHWSGREKTGG